MATWRDIDPTHTNERELLSLLLVLALKPEYRGRPRQYASELEHALRAVSGLAWTLSKYGGLHYAHIEKLPDECAELPSTALILATLAFVENKGIAIPVLSEDDLYLAREYDRGGFNPYDPDNDFLLES